MKKKECAGSEFANQYNKDKFISHTFFQIMTISQIRPKYGILFPELPPILP